MNVAHYSLRNPICCSQHLGRVLLQFYGFLKINMFCSSIIHALSSKTGDLIGTFSEHVSPITSMKQIISNDHNVLQVLSSSLDGSLCLWNLVSLFILCICTCANCHCRKLSSLYVRTRLHLLSITLSFYLVLLIF